MTPSFIIFNWLNTGSDPKVGVQLFQTYINDNPLVTRILSSNPSSHLHFVRHALTVYMDSEVAKRPVQIPDPDQLQQLNEKIESLESEKQELSETNEELQDQNSELEQRINGQHADPVKKTPSLREQFPFLADPDCPNELKILAADKITAYNKVIEYYNALSDCLTDQQLFSTVRNLVHWYKINHGIKKEFVHYKNKNTVLGKHDIFVEYQDLQDLKKLSALQLAELKTQVENNIRHLQKQIKKNNRPDLLIRREEKMRKYKMKLEAIIALLK